MLQHRVLRYNIVCYVVTSCATLRQSCNSVRGTNPQFVNPYGAGENLLTHCVNFTFPDHRKMVAPVRPLAQPTASHKMRMSIHSSLRLRPPPEEPP